MKDIIPEIFKQAFARLTSLTQLKLFGYCAYMIDFKFSNNIPVLGMCIFDRITRKYTIILNEQKFKESEMIDTEYVLYVILHELLHMIMGHLMRLNGADQHIANLAQDHVIYIKLEEEGKTNKYIKTPKTAFFIPELIEDSKAENWTSEQVYRYIIDNYDIKKETKSFDISGDQSGDESGDESGNQSGDQSGDQSGAGDESGSGQSGDQSGNESNSGSDSESGQSGEQFGDPSGSGQAAQPVPQGNPGKIQITETTLTHKENGDVLHAWQDVDVPESMETDAQNATGNINSSLRQVINELKKRGIGSSNLTNWIQNLVEIEIPWWEYFRNLILRNTKPDPANRSWRSINKKYGAIGIISPAQDEIPDINKLLCGVDTSGSMGKSDLAIAGGVIKDMMSNFSSIDIIHHDTIIHKKATYEQEENNCDDDMLCHQFKGGGGTSHQHIFDHIENHRDQYDIVVLVTDFYSDISETMLAEYKWPKEITVIAISTPNYHKTQVKTLMDGCHTGYHLTTEMIKQ